jgi:hypothetical protein
LYNSKAPEHAIDYRECTLPPSTKYNAGRGLTWRIEVNHSAGFTS